MKPFGSAILFITLLNGVAAGATPDCIQQIHFTNRVGDVGKAGQLLVNGLPGVSPSYNNILQSCSAWTFTYNSEGFSAISIELDTASNSVTSLVSGPGSFAVFQGTAVSGTNPSTVTTVSTYSGTGYYPWLQVNLTSLTGTGSIDVTLVGWKSPNYVAGTACPTCALKTLPISQLASTTSAQLAGTLSDETGSGLAVFSASPTFTGTPAAPTQSQNNNSTTLATTAYTDLAVANAIAGVNPAIAVLSASTATITGTYLNGVAGIGATFTVTATGTFSLDGIAINTIGQRILLKDQSSGFQNGVYTATIVGALAVSPVFTRALDYDTPSDINSTGAIPIQSGTVNSGRSYLLTSTVNTVGTDALTYTLFTYSSTVTARTDVGQTFTGTQVMTASLQTGSTAVTQSQGNNSTSVATTAYVDGGRANWATAGNTHIFTFMDNGVLISTNNAGFALYTANQVYVIAVPVNQSGVVNKIDAYLKQNVAATKGADVGVYNSAGNLLASSNAVAPNGQPQTWTLNTSATLTASNLYWLAWCTEDSVNAQIYSIFAATTDVAMYNVDSQIRSGTAANACSGTGASLVMPATLGTITANASKDTAPALRGRP